MTLKQRFVGWATRPHDDTGHPVWQQWCATAIFAIAVTTAMMSVVVWGLDDLASKHCRNIAKPAEYGHQFCGKPQPPGVKTGG